MSSFPFESQVAVIGVWPTELLFLKQITLAFHTTRPICEELLSRIVELPDPIGKALKNQKAMDIDLHFKDELEHFMLCKNENSSCSQPKWSTHSYFGILVNC
jgi:hypothetical protein